VAVAAGRASPELVARTVETVSRLRPSAPDIAKARANGKLILVAEDDQVNQKVILRQLALLGYASDMATNGDEALRFWREGSYALLLTDLHMPNLDGYALCQTIRSEEAGGSRMPIIALTANALRGESVRARAVGMDDYLTKPIPLETLGAILARWIPEPPSGEIPPIPSATAHRGPASTVDVAVLTRLIGDDPVAVRDLLIDFRQSAGAFALQLQSAASSSDLVQVGAIAHKLKSSARTVGALGLGDLCAELENASKAADRSAVKHRLVLFASLLDEVDADIEAYLTC
jgi:CheY-like chemotaxis protein